MKVAEDQSSCVAIGACLYLVLKRKEPRLDRSGIPPLLFWISSLTLFRPGSVTARHQSKTTLFRLRNTAGNPLSRATVDRITRAMFIQPSANGSTEQ